MLGYAIRSDSSGGRQWHEEDGLLIVTAAWRLGPVLIIQETSSERRQTLTPFVLMSLSGTVPCQWVRPPLEQGLAKRCHLSSGAQRSNHMNNCWWGNEVQLVSLCVLIYCEDWHLWCESRHETITPFKQSAIKSKQNQCSLCQCRLCIIAPTQGTPDIIWLLGVFLVKELIFKNKLKILLF